MKLLLSCGSVNRASLCASTALDALVSVDLVFAIAFLNCFNRASLGTSATSDALISDFVSHGKYLHKFCTRRTPILYHINFEMQ